MRSVIPAFGLGNDNNNQASFTARNRKGDVVQVTADMHTWRAPDGSEMVAVVVIPCPNCEFPIAAIPNQKNFSLENGLSFIQHIKCRGQWLGQRGQKRNCGNQFFILQGTAHDPRCQVMQGRCNCGALKPERV